MAGLFDDLIPADPNAAPPLTIQGPGNVQAAPVTAAGPVGPNAQGAPAGAPVDPNSVQNPNDLFGDLIPPQPQDPGVLQHVLNAASRVPQNLSDKLNNIADGLPFSDRARAAVEAATGLGGTFGDYSGNLAATQAAQKQRMQDNPASAIMGQVTGGALPALFGAGAVTLPETLAGKIGTGMASGAGIGSVYGLSASPNLADPMTDAVSTGMGAVGGGIVGGAVPAVGAGFGKAASKLFGQAVPAVTGPNGPIQAPAQKIVMDAIQADGPAAISQGINLLGPNSMLADYGNNLRGAAQGLVIKPGAAGQNIVQALESRNAGTNDRLGQVVQQNLGPVTSPLTHGDAVNSAVTPYAQAQQQALVNAGPVDISGVYKQLQDALPNAAPGTPEHNALTNALTSLTGPDGNPTTNAQVIDSARKGLDDALYPAVPGGQVSSAMRDEAGAYQMARQGVSNALKTQIPAYADATNAMAGITPLRGAYDEGLDDLTRKVSHYPADYRQTFNGLAPNVQDSRAAGLRMAVEQATGTKENDLQALRNVTQGPNGWNSENLATVFGQQPVDNVNQSIAAELRMRDTYGKVTQNAETARREAMAKALEDKETEPFQIGETHNITKEGMVAQVVKAPVNALLRALQPAVDNGARDAQIADAVTAQGVARTQLLAQLLAAHRTQASNSAIAGPASAAGAALTALSPAALAAALRDYRQPSR